MAMNDITYIGFTPAQIDAQIDTEALIRQTDDNKRISDVNTKLISMDELNKDISDRVSDDIIAADTQISQITTNRTNILGNGTDLTASINTVAEYYNSKQSVFAGLESTTSLNNRTDNTDAQEALLESKLNDLSSNVDPNSFKEVYDLVTKVDLNDPETVAGFEFSMRKSIAKLADQGAQEKGKCLIYKDENTKSFYEMYIYNGLIALEEVPNPDKDVILSYLSADEMYIGNLGFSGSSTRIIPLQDDRFIVFFHHNEDIHGQLHTVLKARLYYINQTTKTINAYDEFISQTFSAPFTIYGFKYYKKGNDIICVPKSSVGDYNNNHSVILSYDGSTHISFAVKPYNNLITCHHGVSVNPSLSTLIMSRDTNKIDICNPGTYIVSSTITLPNNYNLAGFMPDGMYDMTSILVDEQHIYALAIKSPSNQVSVLKYLISDQSLVSECVLVGYKLPVYNISFKFIGTKLTVAAVSTDATSKIDLLYIDQETMTIYPSTDLNYAPITLITGAPEAKPIIRDLGNEKILVKTNLIYIYTYDGYQIFASDAPEGMNDISAVSEKTLYFSYSFSTNNKISIQTNPIYKYK